METDTQITNPWGEFHGKICKTAKYKLIIFPTTPCLTPFQAVRSLPINSASIGNHPVRDMSYFEISQDPSMYTKYRGGLTIRERKPEAYFYLNNKIVPCSFTLNTQHSF